MVIKAFKKLFIPHKHNDYKPHFFREASIVAMTLAVVFLFVFSIGTKLYIKNTDMTATVLPAVLVDLTNNARTSNSENTLARSSVLDTAAGMKAEDMAKNGYFAHTSPSGLTPWYWFSEAGYLFVYAGENLAIDFTESLDVENAWLNSPTHKANILNEHFTEIGIATVDGIYQGRPTTYVVQMFGTPAFNPIEEKVEKTETPKIESTPKETTKPKLPATVALAPSVKGEVVDINQKLETITDTKEFVSVKNVSAQEKPVSTENTPAPHYSSWSDRFIFLTPAYTDKIYKIFIFIVIGALLLMTIIEIRKQHPKNIIYGILLLVIVICLVYINRSVLATDFLI